VIDEMKRKKVVVDEIDDKKFLKLKIVEDGNGKKKKLVDYEKLVDELDGKVLSVKGIGKLMKKCSGGLKTKVYYSEVLGMLKRLDENGTIEFERRQGEVIYYKITKVVK